MVPRCRSGNRWGDQEPERGSGASTCPLVAARVGPAVGAQPQAGAAQPQVAHHRRADEGGHLGQVGPRAGEPGGQVGGDDVRLRPVAEVEAVDAGGHVATQGLDHGTRRPGRQGRAQDVPVLGDRLDHGEHAQVGADEADGEAGDHQGPAHGEVEVVEPVPGDRHPDGEREQDDGRGLGQHVDRCGQQALQERDHEQRRGGAEQDDDLRPGQPVRGPESHDGGGEGRQHARHEQRHGRDGEHQRHGRGGEQLGDQDPSGERLVVRRDTGRQQHDAGHGGAGGAPPEPSREQSVGVQQRHQREQRQEPRYPEEALELGPEAGLDGRGVGGHRQRRGEGRAGRCQRRRPPAPARAAWPRDRASRRSP